MTDKPIMVSDLCFFNQLQVLFAHFEKNFYIPAFAIYSDYTPSGMEKFVDKRVCQELAL